MSKRRNGHQFRGGLIDLDSGRISREIFVNDEIYRQEQEQIFARAWLFVGDIYHGLSHRSADAAGVGPTSKERRHLAGHGARRLSVAIPEGGHDVLYTLQDDNPPYVPRHEDRPAVEGYFRRAHEARVERLGQRARVVGGPGTVFPNMSFIAELPRTISVWQPRGPFHTEGWRFYLVDRDAPQEVKDVLRHYSLSYSGPAGLTEQDDMENWGYATAASRGTIARRHPYTYEMGLGAPDQVPDLPGQIVVGMSEQNQRAFYAEYARLMDGGAWPHVTAVEKFHRGDHV